MNTFTKTIWVSQKETFEKKVAHLNRLLAKQGKNPITFKYENYRTRKETMQYHQKGESFYSDKFEEWYVEVCDAVCEGVLEVKKDDQPYTYIGTVSIEEGIKQVFCKDETYSRFFMDDFREGFCDHCHTKRMNRKSYHLFALPDGKVVQIGSTCAKEYFGIDSTAFLETYGRTFFVDYSGCEEDLMEFSRGCRTMSYVEVVHLLDYCTQGFLTWNKKEAYADPDAPMWMQPTVKALRSLIAAAESGNLNPACYKDNASMINLTLEDCIAYWETKADKERKGNPSATVSTFTYNAIQTLKAGYATDRSLGSFAYAIFAAYNNKVRMAQEAAAAAKTYVPCRWAQGTRTDIKGVIINIRQIEVLNEYKANYYNRYYGEEETRYVVDFKDEAGTLYHFTTGGVTFYDVKNNMEVSIRAKVEETKPFKGVPYTRLSRPVCTILQGAKSA